MMKQLFLVAGVVLGSVGVAGANYDLLPLSVGGADTAAAGPGQSLSIELLLNSDAADFNTSAVFTVEFSVPGIQLDSFSWGPGYSISPFVASVPEPSDLPMVIDVDTYDSPFAPGAVDIYFEGFSVTPFTVGALLTLDLTLPAGFQFPQDTGAVTIMAVPDTFHDGLHAIDTRGGTFTLTPEPATVGLLALGGIALIGRRRRR